MHDQLRISGGEKERKSPHPASPQTQGLNRPLMIYSLQRIEFSPGGLPRKMDGSARRICRIYYTSLPWEGPGGGERRRKIYSQTK